MDMVNTIIREIVSLACDNKLAAVITLVVFVFLYIIVFISAVAIITYGCHADYSASARAQLILYTVGMVFYYYGDNIGYIILQYKDTLPCGDQCLNNVQISAVTFLAIAICCYQFFSSAVTKCMQLFESEDDEESTHAKHVMDIVVVIPRIDVFFTTITLALGADNYCNKANFIFSTIFFIICGVIGISWIVLNAYYACHKTEKYVHYILLSIVTAIILLLYLLADNFMPFNCKLSDTAGSALRLSFTLLSVIILGAPLVVYCCYNLCNL